MKNLAGVEMETKQTKLDRFDNSKKKIDEFMKKEENKYYKKIKEEREL